MKDNGDDNDARAAANDFSDRASGMTSMVGVHRPTRTCWTTNRVQVGLTQSVAASQAPLAVSVWNETTRVLEELRYDLSKREHVSEWW